MFIQISQVAFVPDNSSLKLPDSLFCKNMQFSIIYNVLFGLYFGV